MIWKGLAIGGSRALALARTLILARLLVPDDFDLGIAAARVGQEAGVLTLSTAASSTQFGMAVGDLFFSGGITTPQIEGWRGVCIGLFEDPAFHIH